MELALRGDTREDVYRRRRRRPRFNVADGSLFTGDIQFGLSDVSDRLAELNQQIIIDSNTGYGKLSANIINEMIDGSFEKSSDIGRDVPSKEDLRLFFSRLQERVDVRRFYPMLAVPDLDQMYSKMNREDGVVEDSSKFLQYFLSKLGEVVNATKRVTVPVEQFIDICNSYLLSDEPTTELGSELHRARERQIDAKRLRLNPRNLSVHVESAIAGRKISLDALSSGEKQMVSLFARLFLYPGEKIVLVDEPELSLSIDWQKKILADVLSAPLCRQIIAITHSPFVFDNDLEPFARPLQLSFAASPPTSDDAESDEDDSDE